MPKLKWDEDGKREYETGVSKGVLFVMTNGAYGAGVAWNGLTTVTESPSGAESSKQYADNIPYLNIISAEEFAGTIEAFTWPDEFDECDGVAEVALGVTIGQQSRKSFGFAYRTEIGNDTNGLRHGYKIKLIYGATAKPSEKAYATVNESPEAIKFSWEVSTVPTAVEGFMPTSTVTIDSTTVDPVKMQALEALIYGSASATSKLPTPAEVIALVGAVVP